MSNNEVVLGRGTGSGVYRGYRYHIGMHHDAPHPRDEWDDQCTQEMIDEYEEGFHVYYFTIDGIDPERWGSYYYGATHDHSGLMFDIMEEIDFEIDGRFAYKTRNTLPTSLIGPRPEEQESDEDEDDDCGCTSIDIGWDGTDGSVVNVIECSDYDCPRRTHETNESRLRRKQ